MKAPGFVLAASCAVGLMGLAGCASPSQGMGGGELKVTGKPAEPVLFSWQSKDGGISGRMVATLPTSTYTGNFMQITRESERTVLAPMWSGWDEGWSDWPDLNFADPERWGDYYVTREYSGKVLANLVNENGRHMRCRLRLNDPRGGMIGGGQGECQLAGGKMFSVVIDRRDR